MKYLLIWFYISAVCGDPSVKYTVKGPPYFYMQSFDTYEEARNQEMKMEKEGHSKTCIVYGYPQFGELRKSQDDNIRKVGKWFVGTQNN